MIAQLHGRLVQLREDRVVIECGGVGYLVHVAPATLAQLPEVGDPLRLATTLVVREDALTLYGFASEDERGLFEELQNVSGVGPKLALNIVGGMPVGRIVEAIAAGDEAALTSLPGVGKRLAQRLVVELSERVGRRGWAMTAEEGGAAAADVVEALTGLGFTIVEARRMARAAVKKLGDGAALEAVIKEALRTAAEQ